MILRAANGSLDIAHNPLASSNGLMRPPVHIATALRVDRIQALVFVGEQRPPRKSRKFDHLKSAFDLPTVTDDAVVT